VRPTRTQSIKQFLLASAHADLASLYNHDMEVQVNVAQDGGSRVDGDFKGRQWHGFTDGMQTWKAIRIPYKAMSEPQYVDVEISFDLAAHAEGIGMTGWDWVAKLSRWVAFDFDAISGHSDKHAKKLTEAELENLKKQVENVDWVTLRKSTSGKGLHLYVFLDPVPTSNHTEHAALARAVLGKLSATTGFDFVAKVDTCVTADTWTLTSDGPRQVRDLIGKQFCATVNGLQYQTTDRGFWQTGSKEIYEVLTEEGYKLHLTADHPLLVRHHFGYTTSVRDQVTMDLWTEVRNLKPGMKLCLSNHQNLEWEGEGDYSEGYILGWLVGDGYLSKNGRNPTETDRAAYGYMRNGLCLYPDDLCLLTHLTKCFKSSPNVRPNENGSVTVHSREVEELRLKFGLDESKTIRAAIEGASSDFYKGFISALFDTDGSAHPEESGITLTQSDLPRLEAVQRMLSRLGVASKIYLEHGERQHEIQGRLCNVKAKYALRVSRSNVQTFNVRVGFKHPRKKQKNAEVLLRVTRKQFSEQFTAIVKSVTLVGKEAVYDVTVPGPHEFDGNGLRCKNCGGNMWVWHRKMLGTDGLTLLKAGVPLTSVPANWRDHVKVITGRKTKNLPKFIEDQEATRPGIGDGFSELCGQRLRVTLDKDHKRLLEWLQLRYPNCGWWDADNWMLVTHTSLLAEAHEDLQLRGPFKTVATGTERGIDHNCFAYPMTSGAWAVRRFSPGCQEHPSWQQDGSGWTRCFYNRIPDFATACRMYEGLEDPAGGYWFNQVEQATMAMEAMGSKLELPNYVGSQMRKIKLREHKSGRIQVELACSDQDRPDHFAGWLHKGQKWHKLFSAETSETGEPEISTSDEEVRHLISEAGDDCGWVVSSDGTWHGEPYQHVKTYLSSRGYKPQEVINIMGASIGRCWRLVNRPFEPEYPKDRQWNRGAAQLRYEPTLNRDNLEYGTWLKVLRHCGQGLDDAVSMSAWAKANGILSGADYLKCWIASLLKQPMEPLPYLFFYGPQNSGKSIFHEAIALLVTSGVARADTALISQGNFNGELEHAILCVVEETDLRKNVVAYNRIKDWATSRMLPVHKKQRQPYLTPNATHWVQASNSHLACVPGDTWVQTGEGPRQVRELLYRPVTIVHGSQKYPTQGFYLTGHRQLYRVETSRGYAFRATEDHRVLASFEGIEQWVQVKDLKEGYSLCLHDHKSLHWDGEGDFEAGYAIGHLVGDGTFKDQNRPVLYLCQDLDLLPYIQTVLPDARVYERDTGLIVYSELLKQLCEQFGVESKGINEHIQLGSSDFYEGFLSGLFDTNGHCNTDRKKVGLAQSNKAFLQIVQNMLLRLGITSTISQANKAGMRRVPSGDKLTECKAAYALTITMRENLERFAKRIGFKIPRKAERLQKLLVSWRYAHRDVYFTTDVKSVTPLAIVEAVYDVTVPGPEAFSGNGFVLHNCPVFAGDTRITMCYVPELGEGQLIPKRQLIPMLEKEAPDFLAEVLHLELPPSPDRLNIPVLVTEDKQIAEKANQTFLEMFIEERTHHVDGEMLLFSDFYDKFAEWLDPNHLKEWTRIKVSRELPPKFPKGKHSGQVWIGNMSWEARAPSTAVKARLVSKEGKLTAAQGGTS